MFRLRLSHRSLALAAVPLLALAAAGAAQAQVGLNATLTNTQEPPPNPANNPANFTTSAGAPRPISFGDASFVMNQAQTEMTMSVTIFNIDVNGLQTPNDTNDNLVNAHIHAPAPPGSNAGVRWGFFGAPDHDTAPKQLVVTPFGPGLVGGTFTSIWDVGEGAGGGMPGNAPLILAGLSYINFHTVQFGGGEIRGQIVAVAPEPGTLALLGGAAVVAAAGIVRRRRKSR